MKKVILKAKEAFNSWKYTPLEKRIEYMKKVANILEKQKEEITKLIKKEIGKPKIEAETEVIDSLTTINYYSEEIRKIKDKIFQFDKKVFPNTEGFVKFVPHGVIGLITPWNYPLSLPMWTIVPALLAGNTIIFKPSENSKEVGKKIDEIMNSVLPEGVFNTVIGGDKEGKALVKSDIDKLFFTGSVESGKHVMKNIGLKPVSLELGGKDSAIVCEDADLDLTAKGIVWGALTNCGQVCVSIEKVYVHESIANEFIKKVVDEIKKSGKIGRIINKEQLKKIKNYLNDAVLKGAKIVIGGSSKGLLFEHTVLVNVKEDMKIMSEETFGPIIPIKIVKNIDEAVELTNNSKYGLGVTIWTKDIEKGEKIAEKINVGMVWINDVNLPLPGGDYWGGTKESGLRNSESKLVQCLKAKTFVCYSGNKKREWWYPYS